MPVFPPTRHSVIERLRVADGSERSEAFGDLVQGYWKPVYKYLRIHWRLAAEEAEDATQAFFAEAFEKSWFDRFDPGKARFRTFVRLCVDRQVMNAQQAASREKRGGRAERLSIDFAGAEHELLVQSSVMPEADDFFRREFVRALVRPGRSVAARRLPVAGTRVALAAVRALRPRTRTAAGLRGPGRGVRVDDGSGDGLSRTGAARLQDPRDRRPAGVVWQR